MTVDHQGGRVALTFDTEHPDRPARPGGDAGLLDALAALGIRATFFVQGRWAEAWPALARRIADDGHLVGSHAHYHARLSGFTKAGLADDIRLAETAIREATGVDPRPWFRCPFGAGSDDARVIGVIEAAGYRHVGWHVACDDWEIDRTAAEVEDATVTGVEGHGDGAVVLLHSWPDPVAGALPGIVSRLQRSGFKFVGIDELDDLPSLDESEPTPDAASAASVGTAK